MQAEELKAQISVFDVAQKLGIELRKAPGETQQVICPFHEDRDPSARIYADTNSFWCHGCAEGGDVIWMVQRSMELNFSQACKWLAKEFGLVWQDADTLYQRFQRHARFSPPPSTDDPQALLDLLQRQYRTQIARHPERQPRLRALLVDCLDSFSIAEAGQWYSRSMDRLEAVLK